MFDACRCLRLPSRLLAFAVIFAGCVLSGCGSNDDGASLAVSIVSPTPERALLRDARVADIYAAAKRRDERALIAMRDANVRTKATPDPAVALALFTIDATRYRDGFIEAYPQTEDGVNGDYGYRLVQAHIVAKGALLPIKRLGMFAADGNERALKRLLFAIPHAAGRIGDAYDAEAAHDLFAVGPAAGFAALASLPSDVRLAAVAEVAWCQRSANRFLSFSASPAPMPTQPATSATVNAATPFPYILFQHEIRRSLNACELVALASSGKHRTPKRHGRSTNRRAAGAIRVQRTSS